jgi:hypothetical protein
VCQASAPRVGVRVRELRRRDAVLGGAQPAAAGSGRRRARRRHLGHGLAPDGPCACHRGVRVQTANADCALVLVCMSCRVQRLRPP